MTEFQRRVWRELRKCKGQSTFTLAKALGKQ